MMDADSTQPKIALVIEDDLRLGEIFSEALKAAGFETEHVSDGQAAIRRMHSISPAVIVLDLHLPHISGEQILEFIRSQERLDSTKVILATADGALAETLASKVDLILLKPISFSQLQSLAKRLL